MRKLLPHSWWFVPVLLGLASAFLIRSWAGWLLMLSALVALLGAGWRVALPTAPSGLRLTRYALVLPLVWVLVLCAIKGHWDLDQIDEYMRLAAGALLVGVLCARMRPWAWPWMALLQAVSAMALLALIVWGHSRWHWDGRYATYFVDPNSLGLVGLVQGGFLTQACVQQHWLLSWARRLGLPVWLLRAVLALGAASGWMVLVLSGTRGVWLAVLPWALVLWSLSLNKVKTGVRLAVVAALGLLTVWQMPYVQQRLNYTSNEFTWIAQGQSEHSSLGIRVLIHQALMPVVMQSPWVGLTTEQRNDLVQAMPNLPAEVKHTIVFAGSHSQYLEKAVANGLLGLLLAVGLYLAPAVLFYRQLRAPRDPHRNSVTLDPWVDRQAAAHWGLVVCVTYAVAALGLTLTLKYLNSFYALSMALALATLWAHRYNTTKHPSLETVHV